ncbi:LOB domain-containing protein 4-like [Vigna unguiculata]|uniref:Carbamoyl-phosphate synthase large subunit n=1 Tax=Vigna unguiculata TaxID=3917 RepID=A0A4D6M8Q9_VIGUN|nr:LOB domain-containing protein 4-like [Vigna unguiculata]QCD96204.1 carbamoyl-phosphate synthase large subunit [Vigna unguiculata]
MKESGRKQGTMSPCAACKLLRRRCTRDCVFAPYFPADEPQKFGSVHKVFGASNVNKMLQELPEHQRSDAVSSMVYEANARVRDPVYGCVGAISSLQQQVDELQTQLALAQAEVVHMRMSQFSPPSSEHHHHHHQASLVPHEPSNSSSENMLHSSRVLSSQSKSLFGMDMVVDQTIMGQSLWSY